MDNRRLTPALSLIAGVLLSAIGFFAVGFYIYSVIESSGRADKSGIFWL